MKYMVNAVALTCCLIAVANAGTEDSNRLLDDLFFIYKKGVPPTTQDGPVPVNMGFTIQSVDFIDKTQDVATMDVWNNVHWTDPRLRWDPEAYNGTNYIVIDSTDIWLPDIESYDSINVREKLDADAYVYNNGAVLRVAAFNIQFKCSMDLESYPYDNQTCLLKFGSWHHHGGVLNLTTEESVDLHQYSPSRNFMLTSATLKRVVTKYDCCPESYISAFLTLNLERRLHAEDYNSKLILPSVLTGFLVLATFLLPAASFEKITLCGLLFLCLLLQLTYVHSIVPAITAYTMLEKYLVFALFVNFFATILAVVSYCVSRPSSAQVPVIVDTEGNDNELKLQGPPTKSKRNWGRYLDGFCFVLFTIVFCVGLGVILSRRE